MVVIVRPSKPQIIKMKMVNTMSMSTMWIKLTNETTSQKPRHTSQRLRQKYTT